MSDSRKITISCLTSAIILISPLIFSAAEENVTKEDARPELSVDHLTDFLNPDKWFDILKRNITIPISKEKTVNIPTPEEAIRQSSPQLHEIGRGVREETGIDLAKFIGWMAKVLKLFFKVIVDLLETVARSFG